MRNERENEYCNRSIKKIEIISSINFNTCNTLLFYFQMHRNLMKYQRTYQVKIYRGLILALIFLLFNKYSIGHTGQLPFNPFKKKTNEY